jgi:BirA family biotin operon repressor/biotin-[acetyl-CoA-carboxylase] ligase
VLIVSDLPRNRPGLLDGLSMVAACGCLPADAAGAPGVLTNLFRPASPRWACQGRELGRWHSLAVVERAAASQYDALLAAARDGADLPGPVAALAVTGDGFHGNRGRAWHAERGNLHLSCLVPVDQPVAEVAVAVPAAPAVAVCDVLAPLADRSPRIKWINDVLLGGAKTAGVLSAALSRGGRLTTVVYGIGINVALAPAVPPTVFVPRVTCLADHAAAGAAVDLGAVTMALLRALWDRIEQIRRGDAAAVVAAYRERCGDVGRRVSVWPEGLPDAATRDDLPPPRARGRATGLTDALALCVEGCPEPLTGGRLAHDEDGEP